MITRVSLVPAVRPPGFNVTFRAQSSFRLPRADPLFGVVIGVDERVGESAPNGPIWVSWRASHADERTCLLSGCGTRRR